MMNSKQHARIARMLGAAQESISAARDQLEEWGELEDGTSTEYYRINRELHNLTMAQWAMAKGEAR